MKENAVRGPIAILPEATIDLDTSIARLESGFFEYESESHALSGDSPKYTVFVFSVKVESVSSKTNPLTIVKFTKIVDALTEAPRVKLGTLRHYREIEDETGGRRDEMEGRIVEDIHRFLRKQGVVSQTMSLLSVGRLLMVPTGSGSIARRSNLTRPKPSET